MFQKMLQGGGGGGENIKVVSPFTVIGLILQDAISREWTIPEDTDFIMISGFFYADTPNKSVLINGKQEIMGIVSEVGESYTLNYCMSTSNPYSVSPQVLTRLSKTTISLKRPSTSGLTTLYLCKYK